MANGGGERRCEAAAAETVAREGDGSPEAGRGRDAAGEREREKEGGRERRKGKERKKIRKSGGCHVLEGGLEGLQE